MGDTGVWPSQRDPQVLRELFRGRGLLCWSFCPEGWDRSERQPLEILSRVQKATGLGMFSFRGA